MSLADVPLKQLVELPAAPPRLSVPGTGMRGVPQAHPPHRCPPGEPAAPEGHFQQLGGPADATGSREAGGVVGLGAGRGESVQTLRPPISDPDLLVRGPGCGFPWAPLRPRARDTMGQGAASCCQGGLPLHRAQ